MRFIKLMFAVLMAVSVSACSGMKLRETDVNRNPPNDWNNRSFMKNTSDFRFHLPENVGLLVTPVNNEKYQVIKNPIVPDNFTPREDIIKDGAVYRSIITRSAALKGGYLTFASELSASDAVDYSIIDVSRADVPWTMFPEAKIRAAAAAPNPTNIKRLWIQSLILTRIVSNSSTVLDCNGEATAPVFKVGANCHTEASQLSGDYGIAAVFLDIDKWVRENPAGESAENIAKLLSDVQRIASAKPGEATSIPSYISVQPFPGELVNFRKKN
ncbi:hypothetical protein KY487_22945 [Ralstonia pseudosolanacearum]|uniref:hypothetical protein n=1 Tax=Ralstonia pseudosolanacearum TaxID=1310165 RepID=UPI001C8CE6D8|nr:hypothetical protein [Ralstonia pseudosolanacearum]MBX9432105.1 hypothetical protein [Ralstonia pseudosolanacearum]